MGLFGSSEEVNNQKTIDSNGQVNNNIIIREANDVHQQLLLSEKLMCIMYVMCGLEIVKFGMFVYCKFIRKMKKKYSSQVKA